MLNHDIAFMHHALTLARRALGTRPNPAVGCVLVKDGQVVGTGYTALGGKPHAETRALESAGERAKGATAYVTLEPCAHHGNTPPCAEALIKANVKRVVIACQDTDPRVNGKGIAILREAGIEVITGICETEAREFYYGFFRRVTEGLPEINLKVATSADGKIAYAIGCQSSVISYQKDALQQSSTDNRQLTTDNRRQPWITSEPARRFGQLLRAQHDAIVTGIGTVLADDPLLTCRIAGLENHSPIRVVLDRQLRIPLESKLVQTAKDVPLWIVTTENAATEKIKPLEKAGAEIIPLKNVELEPLAHLLAERGMNRVLIEAGQKLNTAAIQSGLLHRIYWFRAPHEIRDGLDAFSAENGWPRLSKAKEIRPLGKDVLEVYDVGNEEKKS